jgi:RNA polymerase sigma-70 factor (ECF subfamily)
MDESAKLALFEQTMVPHLKAAYNLAMWLTRNSPDAEDLVQEAYIKALRYFDGFRGEDGRAWLLAIVRNTCLTWLRRTKSVEQTQPFDERLHGGGEVADPEAMLLNEFHAGAVRDCIEALPLEYREAIILREIEEMSYKEIAEVTSIPTGTVMSRLARARKRLGDCLESRSGARP